MTMKKIAMIIPYFGTWPEWMDLYLYSCSKVQYIDFLFYTDCLIPRKIYDNTIFKQLTFKEYCDKVSTALNIHFNPCRPYKLCDLKPFYGVVHNEELRDYDWWGFSDIDLVYAELGKFVNEENMKGHDILTTHVDRVAGHFTIIRRKSKYNDIAFRIKGWREMLTDDKNHGIDEGDFSGIVKPLKIKIFDKLYYYIIRHVFGETNKHALYNL